MPLGQRHHAEQGVEQLMPLRELGRTKRWTIAQEVCLLPLAGQGETRHPEHVALVTVAEAVGVVLEIECTRFGHVIEPVQVRLAEGVERLRPVAPQRAEESGPYLAASVSRTTVVVSINPAACSKIRKSQVDLADRARPEVVFRRDVRP